MHTITIAGKPFTVQPRYAEGHVLTANEASALNQTYFENLRNNFATKAKDGGSQEDFDKYVESYQFGVRTGGGVSRDPVEVEAMNLARDAVKKGLQGVGKKLSEFSAAAISAAAQKLLDRNPDYREKARQRVEEMQNIARTEIDDDLLATLNEANAAEPETADAEAPEDTTESEAGSRRRRAAAAAE